MRRIVWVSFILCLALISPVQAKSPLIAAASSLRYVIPRLEQAFIAQGGGKIRVSFGSSGNLSRQILQGAPHELFLSADSAYVSTLTEAGLTQDKGHIFAHGRLALIAGKNSKLDVDSAFYGLRAALNLNTIKHFAIANPQHAPYGRAATQALEHAGLRQKIQPFLVYGENIAQTAQFAIIPAAQGGLISHSLALSPAIAARTKQALVPTSWHQPIRHHMVVLKNASQQALNFYKFMRSTQAQKILARHGFSPVS